MSTQGQVIENITAFVAIDDNGNEGVMGAKFGTTFYPFICSDEVRVAEMFPMAEAIKLQTCIEYKVVQFSNRIDITADTIEKFKYKKENHE